MNARQSLNWPPQAKILFTVRRLAPRMGLDILIKAAAPLLAAHSDLRLAIAGKGELAEALRGLAASLGVADRVWFLGTIDDERLQRCYEASDLFVLPTKALECFGLIILEALSFGLPVVASDVAAIPETLRPILPDFMVPAGDPGALRKKLEDWMTGKLVPPDANTLRDFVRRHYSESLVAPKLLNYLDLSHGGKCGEWRLDATRE
jgi:glycosyltransferase involved in cell wall biosynthesis